MAEWGPTLEAKGIETITFTDNELAAFRETVAGPAAAAWVEENTERGLPAAELLDLVTGMVAGD